ncbi:ABC transporter permease [Actinopolyspora mortivallis]|uniref:ABC transporter permease n=1 Tax=Actinopolyspora mortivallis TaxID=33906 RepID=UPI0015E5F5DA|nr:ABC transporter permease [Actinopolyspora mortivallis]
MRNVPRPRGRTGAERPVGTPLPLWLPAGCALALILLPVLGLFARVDPARLPALLTSPTALSALWLSLRTAALATGVSALLGGPLAVVLARSRVPGTRLLRGAVLLPLVLPPVVGGLALLYLLGRTGPVGAVLEQRFGLTLPYTTTAVVLAQTFVAMPFLVVSLEGALRAAGTEHERMAATLGAGPWLTFRRVTLPMVLPALVSGLVLTFARALGEFGATITFAGSLRGTTRTLPLAVYTEAQADVDAAVAMSLLLVAMALLVIVVARPRAVG